MKKFECTLGQYLHERQKILPSAATKVIDQLIGTLELVHASRRTYNDLKLNNIMVNIKSSGISSALVDFGYADYYCSKEGEHIKPDIQLSQFKGNLMLASEHQLRFNKTSRKDDLVSLSYILLFLLNDFELPKFPQHFYEYEQNPHKENMLTYLKEMKAYK